MRIAALYWPTSSVGGINTELRAFRDEADARGHTFHVLRSGKHKFAPTVFKERKLIRGGDTNITIDGEAPHHESVLKATIKFLNENYDRVYLAYLCPHPTKDYGSDPIFLDLLESMLIPITGRITDGYWDAYAEWGDATLTLCDSATVCQKAYADPLMPKYGSKLRVAGQPFSPRPATAKRAALPLAVWISQWKAIKGIHKLLPFLPQVSTPMELYSNGILYYQLRTTDAWKAAIGTDYFAGFNGDGRHDFFGNAALDDIPNILSRASFMVDLQGIGKPKNKVYQQGSFNCTTVEALWYGAMPVLHEQAKAAIPDDLATFVNLGVEVPPILNHYRYQSLARNAFRQAKARDWVRANFDRATIYDKAMGLK